MTDLGKRMARGAAWLVMFRLLERGIGFVSTLILARLLVPGDFGLVAMATSILGALELLGAFSFDLALIQNQQAERRHYDTAWTFGVALGLIKAIGMCALAIPAAHFFREPRVEAVMYALALCTAIQGFDNIGIVAFQKDLELHKEFWLGLIRKLSGFFVTVGLALWLRSHWALVIGVLAMRGTSLVLSYTMHPYRPRLCWSAAGELLNYSKWLLLNNVLIFLNNRGTDFIIGRISGAQALGLYSVAYEVANLPTTELVFPISRAVFPGYARLSGDLSKLREAFLQVIGLVALLTVPAGALIGLAAEPVVRVLLGEKWLDAVPLIQVLAVFGVVRSLHGPTGSIYLAVGKPRFVAVLQAIQLCVAMSTMVYLVPTHGAIGAAFALLGASTLAMCVNYVLVLNEVKVSLRSLLAELWRPLAGALSMTIALLAAKPHMSASAGLLSSLGSLGLTVTVLASIYLTTIAILWIACGRPNGAEATFVRVLKSRWLTKAA